MGFSIILASHNSLNHKNKVVHKLVDFIKKESSNYGEYKVDKLIYNSFSDVINSLNLNVYSKNSRIIIFLDSPRFTLKEIEQIKSKAYYFQLLFDIPEHFNTFYKYAQFLYDGLLIEEPEYKNLFTVFGLPVYDGSLFCNETAKAIANCKTFESLIPINKRFYDFSFIGRIDRPGRKELLENLREKFQNIYVHDSSKKIISDEEMKDIIGNTKYLFNSTSIQPLNTFGFRKFPDDFQLQRKSRIIEYAMNGCIIFSEILPQPLFKTFSKEIIPIIEVPRGANKANFCLEYLGRKDINIFDLSRKSYDAIYNTYNMTNIDIFFRNIINDLKTNKIDSKKIYLNNIEKNKLSFFYEKSVFYIKLKDLINTKKSNIFKAKSIINFVIELIKNKKIDILIIIFFIFSIKIISKGLKLIWLK